MNDSVLELSEVFIASLSLPSSIDRVTLVPNLVITINDDDGTL